MSEQKLKCYCNKLLKSSQSFVQHFEAAHSDVDRCRKVTVNPDKPFPCNDCKRIFLMEFDLKQHFMAKHLPCSCKIHDKFYWSADCKKQNQSEKENQKSFKCYCTKKFDNRIDLERHFTFYHKNASSNTVDVTKSITCPFCNRKHFREVDLKNHFETFHLSESEGYHNKKTILENFIWQEFHCQICKKKAFFARGDLIQHMEAKHNCKFNFLDDEGSDEGGFFECEFCYYGHFNKYSSLIQHIEECHFYINLDQSDIMNAAYFKCDPLKSEPSLDTNSQKNCEDNKEEYNVKAKLDFKETTPTQKFPCKICKNAFIARGDLTQHLEAKHNCKFDSPAVSSDLIKTCKFCLKKFNEYSSLIQHTEAKHNTFLSKVEEEIYFTTNPLSPAANIENVNENDNKKQVTTSESDSKESIDLKPLASSIKLRELSTTYRQGNFFKYSVTKKTWTDKSNNNYPTEIDDYSELNRFFSIFQPTMLTISVKTQDENIFNKCYAISQTLSIDLTKITTKQHTDYMIFIAYCNGFQIFNVQYPASVRIDITPLPNVESPFDEND